MRYIAIDVAWSVCKRVGRERDPAKAEKQTKMPFGLWTRGLLQGTVRCIGARIPSQKAALWGLCLPPLWAVDAPSFRARRRSLSRRSVCVTPP